MMLLHLVFHKDDHKTHPLSSHSFEKMTSRANMTKMLRSSGLVLVETLPKYVYNFRDEVYKNKVINEIKKSTCPDVNTEYVLEKFDEKFVKTPGIRTMFIINKKTNEIAAYIFYKLSKSYTSSRINKSSSLLGRQSTTICKIELLCTNESYRNMGLGKTLIELVKIKTTTIKKQHKTTISLMELETLNKGLCKYYTRHAFNETSDNKYYMKTKDLL